MPYGKENGQELFFFSCLYKLCLFLLGELWPGFSKALTHAQLQGGTGLPGLLQNSWG